MYFGSLSLSHLQQGMAKVKLFMYSTGIATEPVSDVIFIYIGGPIRESGAGSLGSGGGGDNVCAGQQMGESGPSAGGRCVLHPYTALQACLRRRGHRRRVLMMDFDGPFGGHSVCCKQAPLLPHLPRVSGYIARRKTCNALWRNW